MATPLDLRQLAVERPAADAGPRIHKRARLLRWGLPLAILGGFLGIVGWSAREFWLPAKPVTVVPVVLTEAELQNAGTPLFQAAGWIEPRPTPVTCAALVEGIVDELLVVEGQAVEAGEPVARLIDADLKLILREAEATLKLRQAECESAEAALAAAEQHLEQPVHLEAALAEAEATLATLETEIRNLPFMVQAAEARLTLARQDLEGKTAAAEAIAGRSLQKAQGEFDSASAALAELNERGPSLELQREAWRRKCTALRTRLELKTDEHRAVQEAAANLAAAEARRTQAEIAIDTAKLRLERTIVRSPISGRVLSLNTQPGQRLMGHNAASEFDASTVATLYDPASLQVRVDVRLEDVPRIELDQPVRISTAAAKEPFRGTVLAVTSQADIQKNTLAVKASIESPTDSIRPEMLAQVMFLAPERPNAGSEVGKAAVRLLAPRKLVETSEGGAAVWVVDAERCIAQRRAIRLGNAGNEELVEVVQGLNAFDKLIASPREGLAEGERVRIVGVDQTIGAPRLSETGN